MDKQIFRLNVPDGTAYKLFTVLDDATISIRYFVRNQELRSETEIVPTCQARIIYNKLVKNGWAKV